MRQLRRALEPDQPGSLPLPPEDKFAVLFSIIVISRDDPTGLSRTLRSIAMQDFPDYQVVVVTLGTSSTVDPGSFGVASVVHERQSGKGISAAFNQGLMAARGDWINFLNGGDSYSGPDVLSHVAGLARNAVDIVTGRARNSDTGTPIPRDRSFRRKDFRLVSHQASFFRARLFELAGHYSEDFRIRMDFEWMLRLPPATAVEWSERQFVTFEGRGISTTSPFASSLEELRALRAHPRNAGRIVRLVLLYLPFRIGRHWLRLAGGVRMGPP